MSETQKKKATEKPQLKNQHKKLNKRTSPRLWTRGVILGYRRGRRNQYPSISLLKIDGVRTRSDAHFYYGKRVAFIYKAKTKTTTFRGKKTRMRVVWGKIVKAHGNNGAVRARFSSAINSEHFGRTVRVMLFPSNI
eukprot:TRINITY_DN17233_c0_g1_i1.p1 TRINITY_DN17233_c0_g1~~TRINITY_DN17233_c0_g1_i1.p1  ORF type:complete len:136 (+),score=25.05 TRINITY_DN17233_c0_g1_i1:60-467(+)